jgi:Arc/MetJ-type ribon-helix-helix transcriptional regulator
MASTAQVAVRMDAELLERLDWLVARCSFENRADAIRSAIVALAKHEREREIDERIIDGYRRIPQTQDEIEWASRNYWGDLADEDWSELDDRSG